MNKSNRILFLLPCLGMAAATMAQELSGSLTATGDYKAEIRAHSRLSGLPHRLQTQVPEGSLPVATDGLPVDVTPGLETLPASGAGLTLPKRYPGYVSLTAGSYLDASLSAGYRFLQTDHTTLGAWLQHNSSSLFRPETEALSAAEAPRKKLYDETISLYGSHLFGDEGMLSAAATYRLGYFNYYSSALTPGGEPVQAPTQTLNDFVLAADWQASRFTGSMFVDADLRYRYFGYRGFYYPDMFAPEGRTRLCRVKPPRENDIQLGATVGYTTWSSGTVALGMRVREIVYCHPHTAYDAASQVTAPFVSPLGGEAQPYGIASLTPSYSLKGGNWSLRAGVRVDLSWNVLSDTDFSAVHVAPDVAVSYAGPKVTAYLRATGGVEPNTLASRSELDMYQSPAILNTLPQYSPLNAEIGVRLGDLSGFSAGVHAGYAIADNTPLTGWYPYWLAGREFADAGHKVGDMSTMSLKGFSLGADMGYKLGSLLSVGAAVTYQRQSGEAGWFNGPDRPRWTADLSAEVFPIKGLAVGADYRYRGVRRLYLSEDMRAGYPAYGMPDHNFGDSEADTFIFKRLPDICDLGVHARYTLADRFTFSAAVSNILGSDARLHPLMPVEGIKITGGISVLF